MEQQLIRGRKSLNGENIARMLESLTIRRPLVICGERMHGVLMSRTQLEAPWFRDFHPNPDLSDCHKGAEAFLRENCDGLLSLGGGSAMDTAKGIKAVLIRSGTKAETLRHLAIPATAGTGAEATPIAVVYEKGQKLSLDAPELLPEGVLLDSSLLDTLPLYHRKACALDALCQGIESFWANRATAESRCFAEKAVRGVAENLPAYLDGNPAAQDAMLDAAYFSGRAIRISRTTAAHAMSYQLTKRLGYAHGHACMLTLPHLWRRLLKRPDQAPVLAQLADMLGLPDAEAVPDALLALLKKLDLTPDAPVEDTLLDALSAQVNPERLSNHPEPLNRAELRDIYTAALCGMNKPSI